MRDLRDTWGFYARIGLGGRKARTLDAWPHPVIRRIEPLESEVNAPLSHAANRFRPQSRWLIRPAPDQWWITASPAVPCLRRLPVVTPLLGPTTKMPIRT